MDNLGIKCVPISGTQSAADYSDAPADAPSPDTLLSQVDDLGRSTGRTGTQQPSSQTVRASHVVGRTAGRTPTDHEGEEF